MIGCTRCGRWHADAEKKKGRKLSCTDVKQYWTEVRDKHQRSTGHTAQITTDENGDWICLKCGARLF
jgi:hypothetical protein